MRYLTLIEGVQSEARKSFNYALGYLLGAFNMPSSKEYPVGMAPPRIGQLQRAFCFGLEAVGKSAAEVERLDPKVYAPKKTLEDNEKETLYRLLGVTKPMLEVVEAEFMADFSKALNTLLERTDNASPAALVKAMRGAFRDMSAKAQSPWQRVTSVALNDAYQLGRVEGISKAYPKGHEPLLYKRPEADSCLWCKALYLEPDGCTPKLFKASLMRSFGLNNLDRSPRTPETTDWLPVIGSVHPYCQCEVHELPRDHAFNHKGVAVSLRGKSPL